jgi:DNA-binding GntR family transcriptional regulator
VAIQRQALRAQIRAELIRRMTAGELTMGEGINEAQLAAELGVSRTPLREALIAMENDGLIESTVGKGFRFAPANEKEFTELYPVLAALEALALELTPAADLIALAPALIDRANSFSADIAEHGLIMHNDAEWHDLLLGGCPNERLMELITTLKVALRRYEVMLVPDQESVHRHAGEHLRIAQRLTAEDIPGAIAALKENWDNAAEELLGQYATLGHTR